MKDPEEMKKILLSLFNGCMKGRTLYVIPYCMEQLGSPASRIGVQITDSPYVVCNMHIMTRIGKAALDALGDGPFVSCMHSIWSSVKKRGKKIDVALHPPLPHSTWISFRSPSIEVTFRRQTSPMRSPAAYAVVSATRLRNPTTASRKRAISSGARTGGSFSGSLPLTIRSNASCWPIVTPKKIAARKPLD